MFTGIIQAMGVVNALEPTGGDLALAIDSEQLDLERIAVGDSVAVSGVCLTVTALNDQRFTVDVSRETLDKTTLGSLSPGKRVNLESALRMGDPLGGHWVTGHVDGVGELLWRQDDARSVRMGFRAPQALMRYVAEKGSITVDGVSLTVNAVDEEGFSVNLIPHTLQATTLRDLQAQDKVNLEIDLLARYLERLNTIED